MERDITEFGTIYFNYDFNSHAHVERDIANERGRNTMPISTHTLTWSVTIENDYYIGKPLDFNSHAHVERDSCSYALQLL